MSAAERSGVKVIFRKAVCNHEN